MILVENFSITSVIGPRLVVLEVGKNYRSLHKAILDPFSVVRILALRVGCFRIAPSTDLRWLVTAQQCIKTPYGSYLLALPRRL